MTKDATQRSPSELPKTEVTGNEQEIVPVGTYSVPLQVVQGIFKELNEKSDSISKFYSDPIQIGFNDIEQFHIKFTQTCAQYKVNSSSNSFTIFHLDETKEEFSSFEGFLRHNAGSSSPVESVLLKYNLLLINPNSSKPESYTLSLKISSQLSARKRMQQDFIGAPPKIIRIISGRIFVIKVEYVEYVVARSILSLVDEWHKSLPRASKPKFMEILQSNSHLIPKLIKFGTAIFATALVASALPHFLSDKSSLLLFGQVLTYGALAIFIAYSLAGWSSRVIENAVDRWSPVSYVKLNKGDEIEISNYETANRKNYIKGVLGLISAIGLQVFYKVITTFITNNINILH